MKFLHLCLALGAIIPLATSCSQDAPWKADGGEKGKISLRLNTDLEVTVSTRAGDSESPVKPEGERFAIRLENADGSYVKEWENLTKFNDEEGFPRGQYTVTASFGNIDEQGFNNPHYVGTENITVVPGETASHSITATLANSMVSVRYTDAFLNYFSTYSASLVADGISTPVPFVRTETRPAYVKPGNITVNFNIPSPDGREITVSPASFIAQPRRHYIITANVKGAENDAVASLEVLFEENVVTETQEIILDDDLFSSLPPEISIQGFTQDGTIETFESVDLETAPQYQIVAFGGIRKALFTIERTGGISNLPDFGTEQFGVVDLADADPTIQEAVKNTGLKCYGLFKTDENAEERGSKMAVVDLKEFIENLGPGEYKISLAVTDNLGRTNAAEAISRADDEEELHPISLNVKVNAITFELSADEENPPHFMDNQLSVIITTNYAPAAKEFTFQTEATGNNDTYGGFLEPAEIISMDEIESNDPDSHLFRYVLKTDNIEDVDWRVAAKYPKYNPIEIPLKVEVPKYAVEVDAFATKIMLKIKPENDGNQKWMTEKVKFYMKDGSGTTTALTNGYNRDLESGIITIENTATEQRFVPGTHYNNFYASFGNTSNDQDVQVEFSTEAALDVPNGDFEDLVETINTTINQGGTWTITRGGSKHQTTLTMKIKEPANWSSSNSVTCNLGSSNKNSWFTIPSVYNTSVEWVTHQPEAKALGFGQSPYDFSPVIYSDNRLATKNQNAIVIRNVAWDNHGESISHDNKTGNTDDDAWGHKYTNYYCSNQPNISNRTRGSLILGKNGNDGYEFDSRPSSLKGQYKYITDSQDPNEKGLVTVEVLSGDQVIGSGQTKLYAQDSYNQFDCPITYVSDIYNRKATTIRIHLYSSDKESEIKTTNYCNKYECCSRGAMLFVDALEFGY